MKRWTILISLTAFLLSPLTSAFPAEMPSKIINVAVPAVSLLQAPLFVAIDAGAFKKYGMDVRYVLTGARTSQALVGGLVQFAQGVSNRTVPSAARMSPSERLPKEPFAHLPTALRPSRPAQKWVSHQPETGIDISAGPAL